MITSEFEHWNGWWELANKNLLSISEFAKFTGIPRSKLIYYDEIGLFPPAERGENSYRYYALNQIVTAKCVEAFTAFGVPLKQVVPLFQERTPERVVEMLDGEAEIFEEKIRAMQETESLMRTMITIMSEGLKANENEVSIVELDAHPLIIGDDNVFQDAKSFYPAWISFLTNAKKQGHNLMFPVGGMFDTLERFFERPNMPQRFYFINPNGKDRREPGTYLVGYARGFYGETGTLPNRLKDYAEKHKIKLSGPVYNPFLFDELSVVNPQDYLMRIAIKIVE